MTVTPAPGFAAAIVCGALAGYWLGLAFGLNIFDAGYGKGSIVAIVLDENGNPVANVPVFFTLRVPTTTERLDSGTMNDLAIG